MWFSPQILLASLILNITLEMVDTHTTLFPGDDCKPTRTISNGKCTLLSKCEDALRYFRERQQPPFSRCSFSNDEEVICCPLQSQSVTTNPITKKPTTSIITGERTGIKNAKRIAERQCKKIVDSTIPPLDLHIIGGVDASLGEFPHMAALAYDTANGYDFKCGGSLISENYILTAGHCVDNHENVIPVVARMGVVEIGSNTFNPSTDIKISEIIKYPSYNVSYKYHDMALLRLERAVDFSPSLNPACLYTGNDVPNIPLTVTGWGRIDADKDVRSIILQKANVSEVSRNECSEHYILWRKLPDGIIAGQFCAGDSLGRTDACQGDSGGPIQAITARDGHYRVIGITSFGRGCAGSVPGVYTQVATYLEWIVGTVWPNDI